MTCKGAFLVLTLACLGCNRPAPAPAKSPASDVQLVAVHLFADAEGKPGAEIAKFDFSQKQLYFSVQLSKTLTQAKGRWEFAAMNTSAGANQHIQSLPVTFDGNEMKAQIHLGGRPWPIGTYHVDIVLNEVPIGGFDYEVVGASTPITFVADTLAPDDGQGNIGKAVKSFKPTDRTIHILVSSKGIDPTEPEVLWRLFRVVGGKDTEVANTVQPKLKLQDSVFQAQFTSPKDWDKGDYRTDLFINRKLVHSVKFKFE